MGEYINPLASITKPRRNVARRLFDKSPEVIATAKKFGQEYFDGDRKYGYGGYTYDGRWRQVARDFRTHYELFDWQRVLDVGCAKGFLVSDFWNEASLMAFGADISDYALRHCKSDVIGYLHHASADDLPFPNDSFDLVISINTIHNLPRERAKRALQEITRVSRGPAFVQVDAYRTEEERRRAEDWIITAEFWGSVDEWLELFAEAGYVGDYCWTIV